MTGISYKIFNANLIRNSLSNGLGVRHVLFISGCPHNCDGCHNPETHNPKYGEEWTHQDFYELCLEIENDPKVDGLTLSGGDPLFYESIAELIFMYKRIVSKGKDLWLYTGYTKEEIEKCPRKSKAYYLCDVVVDGRYEKDLPSGTFAGSNNQKLHHPFRDTEYYAYGHKNPDVDCFVAFYILKRQWGIKHCKFVMENTDVLDSYTIEYTKKLLGRDFFDKEVEMFSAQEIAEKKALIALDTKARYANTLFAIDHHGEDVFKRDENHSIELNFSGVGSTALMIVEAITHFKGVDFLHKIAVASAIIDTSFLTLKDKYSNTKLDYWVDYYDFDVKDFIQFNDPKDIKNGLKYYDGFSVSYLHVETEDEQEKEEILSYAIENCEDNLYIMFYFNLEETIVVNKNGVYAAYGEVVSRGSYFAEYLTNQLKTIK